VSASAAMPMAGRHIMSSPQLFSYIGHDGYNTVSSHTLNGTNPPIVTLAMFGLAGFEACSDGVNLLTKVVLAKFFEEKTF
jgi:hypothetical protein